MTPLLDIRLVRYFLPAVLCLAAWPSLLRGQNGEEPPANVIRISSDGPNTYTETMAQAEDNVIVRFGKDVIYADRVTVFTKKRDVIATGNVRLYMEDRVYRGEKIFFNFDTRKIISADFRLAEHPWYIAGEEIYTPRDNNYRIINGFFTTDNRADPQWKLKASEIDYYPDDEIVFRNVLLYFGDVPVAWLPYFNQSLQDSREGYDFEIGQKGRFGFFFYNRYNTPLTEHLRATAKFDLRETRGLAGGLDLDWTKDKQNEAHFRGYYLKDELYSDGEVADVDEFRFPGVEEDRFLFDFRAKVRPSEDLNIITDINIWSDEFVTRDFFENDFRERVEPDNFFYVSQQGENYSTSAMMRAGLMNFFEAVERLPEARLDIRRQKLFDTDLAYESESSLVALQLMSPFEDRERFYTYRWDTFHQLSYPRQYFNWLNFEPWIGVRGTVYSDDNLIVGDYEGPNDLKNEPAGRLVPNVGFNMQFKLSKTWADYQNKDLGIDGLRHIVEPFVKAQYIPTIVGAKPDEIRGFDDRLPSTRLPSLDFPAINSIDSIDTYAVVRSGVRQRWQTRRDGRNYELLSWEVAADLDISENFSSLEGNLYSNVFSDLRFRPVPWLTLSQQAAIDVSGDSFTQVNTNLLWHVTPAFEFQISHSFLKDSPVFSDSNLINLQTFYRLNENWQFETRHSFELDEGELQEQRYTIYRDLTTWQIAFTFGDRLVGGSVGDSTREQLFYLTLTLKEFPGISLQTEEF